MVGSVRRRLGVAGLLAGVMALAVACGGGSTGGGGGGGNGGNGGGGNGESLKGVSLTVGGKEFTEQLVLCKMTVLALQAHGANVSDKCGLHGSNSARRALTSGDIDMYWEYTGTAWINYLKHSKGITNSVKQYKAVAKEDLQKNHIKWLKRSDLNNTYAVAAAKEVASKLGVSTMSDYANLVHTKPSEATLCVASEFANRSDGLPGLEKAYGFKVAKGNEALLQEGAIYNAIDKQNPCNFGEAFTTDGRIAALNLTVLKDDKHFFPKYNVALNVRDSVYKKDPQIAKIMNPIAAALNNTVSQQLGKKVDVDGQDPNTVAKQWLQKKGFMSK